MQLVAMAAVALMGGSAVAAVTPASGAPDFTLPSLDGPNLRLQEQRGQVVMINFWATWCGPCRVEMPHLARLYDKYRGSGFTVLAVNFVGDGGFVGRGNVFANSITGGAGADTLEVGSGNDTLAGEAGIDDATLSRPFWRGIKFYAAKDGRGWDILRIRTWLTKGADDSFISKCVLYVWRADINAIWPSAVPDENGLELVGSEPIVTTQVLKHTEAAPIESLKPAEPEAEPSKLVGTTPIIDQAAQSQTAKRAGGEPTNAKVPPARRLGT